jgi:hypothetical protein
MSKVRVSADPEAMDGNINYAKKIYDPGAQFKKRIFVVIIVIISYPELRLVNHLFYFR